MVMRGSLKPTTNGCGNTNAATEMLEHDLSYPYKKRLHCCNCNMELEHFNTDLEEGYDEDGNRVTLVNMECRVCEEAPVSSPV